MSAPTQHHSTSDLIQRWERRLCVAYVAACTASTFVGVAFRIVESRPDEETMRGECFLRPLSSRPLSVLTGALSLNQLIELAIRAGRVEPLARPSQLEIAAPTDLAQAVPK